MIIKDFEENGWEGMQPMPLNTGKIDLI